MPADAAYTKAAWVYWVPGNNMNNIISGKTHPGHAFWVTQYPEDSGVYLSAGHQDPWREVKDTSEFPSSQWVHVALTYDPAGSGTMVLYRDGVEVDTSTSVTPNNTNGDTQAYVGAYNGSVHFKGYIDDARIYTRALSGEQIAALYNSGAGNSNVIVSQETDVGDEWQCRVTPFSESDTGATYPSNVLTIQSTGEPHITSIPVTQAVVGELYTYDVEADGDPAPTYTLTTNPTGMTIDENTGEISWTPTATGDYDVVVEAHNTEGDDQQSFVLSVSEPPPFALRINCGGSTVVDGAITWESSAPYVTGGADYTFSTSSVDTTTNSIEEPVPPLEVYKACRHQSPHTYDFPSVPNGDYIVRIHWTDQAASAGLREIDYDIEGVRVEEDWDIYAEAGGTFVAIDKAYEVTVSDGNGLQITSSADSGDAFESAIEITSRQDEAPQITSTPVTRGNVGCLYTYEVDASGNPPPTYTLTVAPSGMTIDENTGVIEWTSDTAGDSDVTVEAANSEGMDSQSFTIEVATCPCAIMSYWKLDETGSPTTFEDTFGDNDGQCSPHGCPTPTTGKVSGGQAIAGGSTGVGIDVPADPSFDWGKDDSFSIEFWMKRSGDIGENDVIVGRDEEGPGSSSLHWWVGVAKTSGKPTGNLVATNGDGQSFTGSTNVNDGNWHHLVFVRDATSGLNLTYVDGQLDGSEPKASYSAGFGSATAALNIGWLSLHTKYTYDGIVDEVALYNRALPLPEIQQHHQGGLLAGLGYCEMEPVAPTITSSPVTQAFVAVPYSYDVEAIGYPAPTYTLTTKPTGMTIDEDTGVIAWTPSAIGDYDVTVVAANGEEPDASQSFIISVPAVTPCPPGMTSYWRLDETSSGSYEDSYDDNDGACAGACPGPTADGKVNGGQVFDGSTTGIDVLPDPSFDWGPSHSFSIEFWMRRPGACAAFDVPHNEVIVGRDDASTNLHWWVGVSCNDDGKALFGLVDTDAGGDDAWAVGDTVVTGGVWHHIVAVRNADEDQISIYVDGEEEDSAPAMFSAGFDSSSAALNLGWLNLSPGYHFEGTLDEVALYNRALSETEIKTHYYLARGYCDTCATPVRIMPLGDSITVGNASGVVPDDDAAHWVSYRKDLWESLEAAGYDVDFVGGQTHGDAFDPPFDSDHEGHGGWTDSQIRDTVVGFLTANPGDVVLLHIGTNGLNDDPTQVEEILDNIDSVSEDITVILARIINRRDGSTTTTQFNDNVEEMAEDRMDPASPDYTGDKIIIVDMENGAGIVYGQAPSAGDMWDNLHPYETGYAKMVNVWLNGDSHGSDGLADFLPICAPPTPTPPEITSDPVTEAFVGWPYTYDVEATGSPVPTYTLTTKPTGMTIDEDTGLIEWTPGATGDYDVTVEARNSEGTDAQESIIHVAEPPPCPPDMISYWKLDETSGSTFYDYYDGNDASCDGHCSAFATGLVDGALDFDGTSDYLTVADDPSLDWASDDSFTIELWAKLTNCDSRNKVMIGRDDRPQPGVHWWLGCHVDTKKAAFVLYSDDYPPDDGASVVEGPTIDDGNWHHLVATRDASANTISLYVDGSFEGSTSHSYVGDFGAPTTLGIGYMAYSGTPDYFYDGLLDEVALYSRVLSAAEIEQHYNAGQAGQGYCEMEPVAPTITSDPATEAFVGSPYTYDVEATGSPVPTYTLTTKPAGMTIDEDTGLIEWTPGATGDYDVTVEARNSEGTDAQEFIIHVAEPPPCPPDMISYWKLDETSGPTYDDYYDGNDGACAGQCPSQATGQVDGGQEFNGSNTGIDVPANVSFDWSAGDSFSIEYWMKKDTACSGNEVIAGRDDSSSSLHWWTGCWSTGEASFVLIATNGDGANSAQWPHGTTDLTDGSWHHIVVVRDASTNENRIYVDGVEEDSKSVAYSAGFGSSTAALNLGWMNLSGGYHFEGTLDEVAIYDRALSPAEVAEHYYSGQLRGNGYCEAPAAFVWLSKEASVITAWVGDVITYTYTIVNIGGMTLDPITLMDDQLGTIITGTDGITLIPGASITVTATHTVQESDLPGPIVNVATASGVPEEGEPVTDTDTASVELTEAAIEVVKVADPTVIYAGDTVTYTYSITNDGNVTLSGVTLADDKLGDIALAATRVATDLVVLYTFHEGSGLTVHDVSGAGTPLNLTVEDPTAVSWIPGGRLSVDSPTIVASAGAGTKIIDACKSSNEITIEAWVKPANNTQGGPARIVTLSDGGLSRNFTLGQEGSTYDTRLRTTATSDNGIPSLTAGTVSISELSHIVYTRDASGVAHFYVNGVDVGSRSDITGDLSNWDEGFHFGLANEFGDERSWLGEYDLVAIYNRALSQTEVIQNYEAQAGITLSAGESITATMSITPTVDTINEATVTATDPVGRRVSGTDTATVTVQSRGSITIVKQTDPPGGTGFSFDAGILGGFSLDDGGSQWYADLPAGDYDVTEEVPTGWNLADVVCTGGDSTSITDGVTIHLDPGEDITCTFTNETALVPGEYRIYLPFVSRN